MKIFKLALLSLLAISTVGASGPLTRKTGGHDGCSMFPPNNLRFPVRAGSGISESTFRQIILAAQETYRPIFRQAGLGLLQINPRWEVDEVNAVAYPAERPTGMNGQKSIVRMVEIAGGLARHPMMNGEGLLLVICHEIGHHLAGFPRYEKNTAWGSTEGQSDYFATSKCAREVLGRMNNSEVAEKAQVPLEVRTACRANFPQDPQAASICVRSALGGLSLASVLGSLGKNPMRVDFRTPDRRQVPVTFEGHPPAQCRLDTYMAGALCQVSHRVPFSPQAARQGACTPDQRFRNGFRPTCWFSAAR